MTDEPARSTSPRSSSPAPTQPPSSEDHPDKTWKDLAKEASEETDPQKLITIVKDLCSALDHEATPHPNAKPEKIDRDNNSGHRTRSG